MNSFAYMVVPAFAMKIKQKLGTSVNVQTITAAGSAKVCMKLYIHVNNKSNGLAVSVQLLNKNKCDVNATKFAFKIFILYLTDKNMLSLI
jgi:hypothetical protein